MDVGVSRDMGMAVPAVEVRLDVRSVLGSRGLCLYCILQEKISY